MVNSFQNNNMHPTHTLCYLIYDQKVLLGFKKRGFGKGKWNGFGGKIKEGESTTTALIREIKEESGIAVDEDNLIDVGLLRFFYEGEEGEHVVKVFITTEVSGRAVETEEMKPKLFMINDLPLDQMWLSDSLWVPKLLSGMRVTGEIYFDGAYNVCDNKLSFSDSWR